MRDHAIIQSVCANVSTFYLNAYDCKTCTIGHGSTGRYGLIELESQGAIKNIKILWRKCFDRTARHSLLRYYSQFLQIQSIL